MPEAVYEAVKIKLYEPGRQSGTMSVCHPDYYYEAVIPVHATASQLLPIVRDNPELYAISEEYGYIAPYGEAEPVLELESFAIKMDDAQAVTERIYSMLKDLVTGPMSQSFNNTGPTSAYCVRIVLDIPVAAQSPKEAMDRILSMYPNAAKTDIQDITENGNPLGYARNQDSEDIWFRPACPYGETDCCFDPMREKAENCKDQVEADALDIEDCPYYEDDATDCNEYRAANI